MTSMTSINQQSTSQLIKFINMLMEPRSENSKIKSIREDSNSQDDNYQDEYSQIIQNELKDKIIIRNSLKKENEESMQTEIKKDATDFRVRSASSKNKIDITKKTEYRHHLIE